MKKIAVITPIGKNDYLASTVFDGLIDLAHDGEVEFRTLADYPAPFSLKEYILSEADFISYAHGADLIILTWGKGCTNFALAEKINKWDKTVFVDGSELGKDRRSDPEIQAKVLAMTYEGGGAIDKGMLEKCKKYLRREKPYIKGILPFPFGIERRYREFEKTTPEKDIDFVCIFGQEDFPKMRKGVRLIVEDFCKKNGFKCVTKKTSGFTFDDSTKLAGRSEFYSLLARAKVGVSVGGGGYDTARFWEVLANDCILLTEKIDIEMPKGAEFVYDRVHEFTDVAEFKAQLEKLGAFLRSSYKVDEMKDEFNDIIQKHSTKARMKYLLSTTL